MHAGSGVSDADYLAERTAYTDCCQTGIDLTTDTICVDYLSWRPTCSDNLFSAPSASGSEGDPHFVSFDGFSYTFNGIGTFVLIRAPVFELQGLFVRATDGGGTQLDATVFKSVVGQQLVPSSDVVEMEVDSGGSGVNIMVNGALQTIDFTQFPLGKEYTMVIVKRITNADSSYTYQMVFLAGFTINVTPFSGLLGVSVAVLGDWANQLTGLMGNFNSDPTDDAILSDGTNLGDPNGYTEEQLYTQFGLPWRVLEADSLFTLSGGDTFSSVNNDAGYTPIFFNPDLTVFIPDSTTRDEAQTLCYNSGQSDYVAGQDDPNPSSRRECYFDFRVTGDSAIASNTADGMKEVADTQTTYANFAPAIQNADVTLAVEAGQTYSNLHTLTVTDANNDNIMLSVVTGTVDGVAVNSATGVVSFTNVPNTFPLPTDPYSFEIKISASDGQVSTLWEPKLKYCICQNGGTCDFSASTVTIFTIVPCQCPVAYDGQFCETDRDGCSDTPCAIGVECTDVPVSQMDTYPDGFICGNCPIGLVGDGQSCEDDDECSATVSPCDHVCTNVVGTFYCSCNTGYILGKDLRACEDINECSLGTDNCDPVASCTNTQGSYSCACPTGYTGTGITGDCQNVDECSSNPCPTNSACVDNTGSYTCVCDTGYEYNPAGNTCDDIDDCLTDTTCEQLCTDGVNTVSCSCRSGFVVDGTDNTRCNPSTTCDVAQRAQCDSGNTARSSCAVDGGGNIICVCNHGYALNSNMDCINIDECTTQTDQCVHATCVDTDGGYTCNCETGYQAKAGSDYICEDINECSGGHSCVSPATCVNSDGSYGCQCPTGYYLAVDGLSCVDINECADPSLNNCDPEDGLCEDTAGGYTCSCKTGYTGNGIQCYDLNECQESGQGGCLQGCRNTIGGHICFCNAGYSLNSDGLSCDNIDECATNETNTCSHKDLCTNTAGSYTCGCPAGFIIKADQKTCVSESDCSPSKSCDYDCNVVDGVDTCTCGKGYQLNANGYSCDDINECQTVSTNLCPDGNNVICQNLAGGYQCVCTNTSYQQVQTDLCVDVDECESSTDPCPANEKCVNLNATYRCDCLTGYTRVSEICVDKNECSNGEALCHPLLATCTNTPGAYTCACITGYQGDGMTCNEIDECSLGTADCDSVRGICTNTPFGSYTCSCPDGYSLASDSKTCIDDDECQLGTSGCGDICTNIPGGYTCDCQAGFNLAPDLQACIVANECEPGHSCAHLCAKIDGTDTCACNSGYELVSGTGQCQDINECTASPPCDSVRGICANTDGGYRCACDDSYTLGPNNVCNDRDGGFTEWSSWSTCSVTCGNGAQTRSRTCTNPTQEGNGADCSGDSSESQSCRESACAVTLIETNNGIQFDISGMTLAQVMQVLQQLRASFAQSINAYCNLNEERAQECCNNNLNFSPLISMLLTNADGVLISDGYPYEMENTKLHTKLTVKYRTSNTLCASGTARRRKRAVTLADDELLMTQALLLKIVQLQQYDIVQSFIDGSAVTLGETLTITMENIAAISANTDDTTSTQNQRTPDWVIVVSVLGAVLFIAVIAVIVVAVIKMRPSNKVGVREPADASEAHRPSSGPHPHRRSVHHHGETDAPGPSIREQPHLPPSSNRGQPAPRVGPRPSNRVLTVAPMETIDI